MKQLNKKTRHISLFVEQMFRRKKSGMAVHVGGNGRMELSHLRYEHELRQEKFNLGSDRLTLPHGNL